MKRLAYRLVVTCALFIMCALLWSIRPAYAAVTVSNETELIQALANGESEITTTGQITITQPINITQRAVTIHVSNLTLAEGVNSMFVVSSAGHLKLVDGTLDGQKHGRLVEVHNGSQLTIENSTVTNGSTDSFEKKLVNGVNEQRYQGGAIWAEHAVVNLVNATFSNNYTKLNAPLQEPDKKPDINTHGGAIYAGASTVNITGGAFLDNYSGATGTEYYGEGGAIKLEVSTLKINESGDTRTRFEGNHNYKSAANVGGLQGGAIEATETSGLIRNTDFVVKGGFDTGGAIKFERSGSANAHFEIQDSTFKLVGKNLPTAPVASTYFGTSGGAIMSEGSYLTVHRSTFTMDNVPAVSFAGGHIDVVGTGEFKLLNSTLSGNGIAWNSPHLTSAKYGGALAFENGASVKAEIRDTTFTNFTTDHVGGVIAVGHRTGTQISDSFGHTSVKLNMYNTILDGGRAYVWNALGAGAGMYISEGSEVVISGGRISNMQANYGSAIFNKGALTLIDKAQINNNNATQMVGGIFNDGYLNVHSAVLTNNQKTTDAYFAGGNHELSEGEHSGGTIYAKQNVIVGTDARFDTSARNDVRVIDGQSAVILSGSRTQQLNISISEKENAPGNSQLSTLFGEKAHRHIGYVVSRGLQSADLTAQYTPEGLAPYTLTPQDAQSLHYVSNTVPADTIAAFNDHTSPAKWDYVYNPETHTAVLGQRAVMVYHTNHDNATIKDGQSDTHGQKLEQTYTFYDAHKVSVNNVPATDLTVIGDKPELRRDGIDYNFRNWYTSAAQDKSIYDAVQKTPADSEVYNFSTANFARSWSIPDEVTEIIDADSHNTLHTYAVYDAVINVEVTKVWQTTDDTKHDITFVVNGGAVPVEKTLPADSSQPLRFENLPRFAPNGNEYTYTVAEKGASNGIISLDGRTYRSTISKPEKDDSVIHFTATNQLLRDVAVTKVWSAPKADQAPVEVQLLKNGANEGSPVSLTSDFEWKHVFKNLPAVEVLDGKVSTVTYTVKEVGESENKLNIGDKSFKVAYSGDADKGFIITNTRVTSSTPITPATTTLKVQKVWEGTTQTTPVKVQLERDGQAVGDPIELSKDNKWSHTFTQLPVQADAHAESAYTYNVKEIGEAQGTIALGDKNYSVAYSHDKAAHSITITNTLVNPHVSISGKKVWVDDPKDAASRPAEITVELTVNGKADGVTASASEATKWAFSFDNLPTYDKNGEPLEYSVKERSVEGYTSRVTGSAQDGFTITNTRTFDMIELTPGLTSITVRKEWKNTQNKQPIKVQLMRDDKPYGAPVELSQTNKWEHKFENLPRQADVHAEKAFTYAVKEVGENSGKITLGDRTFVVTYQLGDDGHSVVITNSEEQKSNMDPKPEPEPEPKPEPEPNTGKNSTTVKVDKRGTLPRTNDASTLIIGILAALGVLVAIAGVILRRK
ncbi:Cna B-type domain-containing protein [Alloscardovia omnicolens]|uniref:Cna B-type domain-containing protein n=1 Tax=Alloscardovia omnicolens TaxID=419015 RepID=UPI003A615B28